MKEVEYRDLKFYRDDERGYYLSTKKYKGKRIRLHRYKWMMEKGEIPEGHHIHHIDGDATNNDISNLQLISPREHVLLHPNPPIPEEQIQDFIEKAKKWHRSKEGREWHSQHIKKIQSNFKERTSICQYCDNEFTTQNMKIPKFCSLKCKAANRRKSGVDNEARLCKWCGESFEVNKYHKTETCSKRCGIKLSWKRRKDT